MSPSVVRWGLLGLWGVASGLAACTEQQVADCGTNTTTWAGDAETCFASYCIECHSTALTGSARQDAPASINFDTYDDLTANDLDEVSEQIDSGSMPNSDASAFPTDPEIDEIVAWLDCGAAE